MVKILVRHWLRIHSMYAYMYSHQYYASARLVDRVTLQFNFETCLYWCLAFILTQIWIQYSAFILALGHVDFIKN